MDNYLTVLTTMDPTLHQSVRENDRRNADVEAVRAQMVASRNQFVHENGLHDDADRMKKALEKYQLIIID